MSLSILLGADVFARRGPRHCFRRLFGELKTE